MKICDFCSTAKILMDFIGESKNINQIDFMYELFKDFMESDEAKDFDFDNGLVCRWLNGTAKLSPKITAYYSALGNLEAMAIDIEENILPLFYDKDMAVTELYDLLMSDTTVSETKKQELADNYPYKDDADISNFISKLVFFGMERKFIKRDANTKKLIASGALSPQTKDYIYSLVPKPCKHFCGRDNELEKLHTMLEDENKIFIQGIAGIGKSEFVKMYAQKYKKEYTNICLMDILEIKMPCISKDGKQFNITPPLLFRFQYIDQDEGWSKIADSFKNVAYIKDWKANTNKYVCGYLDDSYYALQAQKAEHILERDDKKKELNYNQNFVSRITSTLTRIEDIESVEDVTTDIELLLAKAEELRKLQFSYNAEMTVLENDIYINQHKLHIVEHNLIETKKILSMQ